MNRDLSPARRLRRWNVLMLMIGTALYVSAVNAQQAAPAKKEEIAAEKMKFKIDLVEKDDNTGKKSLDAKIKDKNGNEPSPITDPNDKIEKQIYDFTVLTIIRYEGSSCTRICKTLSNGTTTCYKDCS
jgi:hypothetical protein